MTDVFIKADIKDLDIKPVKREVKRRKRFKKEGVQNKKESVRKRTPNIFRKIGNIYEAKRTFQHICCYEKNGKLIRTYRCTTCNIFVRKNEKHCSYCSEMLTVKTEDNSHQVSKPPIKYKIVEKSRCRNCNAFLKKGQSCRQCDSYGIVGKKKVKKSSKKAKPSDNNKKVIKKPLKTIGSKNIAKNVKPIKKGRIKSKKVLTKTDKALHNIRCSVCKGIYVREKGACCKFCKPKATYTAQSEADKTLIKYSFVNVDEIKESINEEPEKNNLNTLDVIEIDDDGRDAIDKASYSLAIASKEDALDVINIDCDDVVVDEPESNYYVSINDINKLMNEDT